MRGWANPKSEIRNPKQIQNSKKQTSQTEQVAQASAPVFGRTARAGTPMPPTPSFEFASFGFVSDFEIRIYFL
jgi:hypothetical protein